MSAYVSAVIVAAGGSVRMGIADSKQFIPLLDKPAIEYTLKAFQKCYLIKEIVIVCREQDVDRINELVNQNGFTKVSKVVLGGSSRSASVRNGIKAANEKAKYLLFTTAPVRLLLLTKLKELLRRLLKPVRQPSEHPLRIQSKSLTDLIRLRAHRSAHSLEQCRLRRFLKEICICLLLKMQEKTALNLPMTALLSKIWAAKFSL